MTAEEIKEKIEESFKQLNQPNAHVMIACVAGDKPNDMRVLLQSNIPSTIGRIEFLLSLLDLGFQKLKDEARELEGALAKPTQH